MPQWKTFVSYSHHDEDIVRRFTELMKIGDDSVFRDKEAIPLGSKWGFEIMKSMNMCSTVVVFWTHNTAKSNSVREEYLFAIRRDLDVVPVLLDNTPLTEELLQYQFLDLRRFANVKKSKSPILRFIIILIVIIIMIVIIHGLLREPFTPWMLLPFCMLGMVKTPTEAPTEAPKEQFEENRAKIYRMLYERIIQNKIGL